jgi:hypothetical protein
MSIYDKNVTTIPFSVLDIVSMLVDSDLSNDDLVEVVMTIDAEVGDVDFTKKLLEQFEGLVKDCEG